MFEHQGGAQQQTLSYIYQTIGSQIKDNRRNVDKDWSVRTFRGHSNRHCLAILLGMGSHEPALMFSAPFEFLGIEESDTLALGGGD